MRAPPLALLSLLAACGSSGQLDPRALPGDAGADAFRGSDASDSLTDAAGSDASATCSMATGCPTDQCEIQCCPGAPECAPCCTDKPCQNIPAAACPVDRCQVMTRCDGAPACYPPFSVGPQPCGDSSNYRQDVACCPGLEKRCGMQTSGGSCDPLHGGYNDFPWCLPCGNGHCDQFENHCSCPEDCS